MHVAGRLYCIPEIILPNQTDSCSRLYDDEESDVEDKSPSQSVIVGEEKEQLSRLSERNKKEFPSSVVTYTAREVISQISDDEIHMKIKVAVMYSSWEYIDRFVFDKSGQTALIWAIQKNEENLVELLLSKKFFYRCKKPDERAAIYLSVLNRQDKLGMTALHWAVQLNKVEICQELVAQGVNLDTIDKCGRTALMFSTGLQSANIMQLLLNHQADYTIRDIDGLSAYNRLEVDKTKTEHMKIMRQHMGVDGNGGWGCVIL